jgi:hypothetical protein
MTGNKIVPKESAAPSALTRPQRAAARLQFGERFSAVSEVEVTPAGLLAIGGMVGAILLGSAAVVLAAGRRYRRG